MLAGEEVVRAGYGSKGEEIIRVGYGYKRSLFNFFFDSTTCFNKLQNLDEYSDIGTY